MYAVCKQNGKTVYMHRFLLNAPKGVEVDHMDWNGLNNRRKNLRLATKSQNRANTGSKNGSGKYKGVTECLTRRVGSTGTIFYKARIHRGGVCYHLGVFKTAIEAAKAYDKRIKVIDGQFAMTNKHLGLL